MADENRRRMAGLSGVCIKLAILLQGEMCASAVSRFHPDIVRISTAYANAYLIRNGRNSILVDSGLDRSGRIVLSGIATAGLQPSDIRLLILTHPHFDHCTGARALGSVTGAEILVHKEEESCYRRGYGRLPRGVTFPLEAWVKMGRLFMPWLSFFPPVTPNILITEQYDLEHYGIAGRVIHTPGHTKGSLSVILDGKHAIAGDNIVGRKHKPIFPPFADDPPELIRSWKKLIDEGIEYLYPGHGHPFGIDRLIAEFEKRRIKYRLASA